MKTIVNSRYFHPLLLLLWFLLGIALRCLNLGTKPPWTDEFSTLAFSLGNGFLDVPINQIISVDTLLQPIQIQADKGIHDVLERLLTESNHPPLYFILTHLWTRLFPTEQGLVSVWGARSLAAIFGAFSVPATYSLSSLSFRSRLVAHLSAALMAVSPFSIFLSQEARHYTLAILWAIASFGCLVVAARCIRDRVNLPVFTLLIWIVVNALGIASHYFFVLTLFAEGIALIFVAIKSYRKYSHISFLIYPPWRRIYAVAIGTAISGLVWLPIFLQNSYGNKLTDWIQGERTGFAWVSPLFQALAAWVTMISLLPVESPQLTIVIISGLIMIGFFIWITPILWKGVKVGLQSQENQSQETKSQETQSQETQSQDKSFITQILIAICLGSVCLFFFFTYFLGIDLTRGARYNFSYFPAVIILIASSLAVEWQSSVTQSNTNKKLFQIRAKKAVVIVLIMGLFSAITVTSNLGYQKYYRPDLFLNLIQKITTDTSPSSILITTTQRTHVQVGEMMGIARELKLKSNQSSTPSVRFLLVHQENKQENTNIDVTLNKNLEKLSRPFDLWLVNFHASPPNKVNQCQNIKRNSLPGINGYEYKIFHCS